MKEVTINLEKHGGPIYSGRERGSSLREKLGLDELDKESAVIEIVVPEDTYTITSSFWLGLLSPSVKFFGTKEKFFDQYCVRLPDRFQGKFQYCVERALTQQSGLI